MLTMERMLTQNNFERLKSIRTIWQGRESEKFGCLSSFTARAAAYICDYIILFMLASWFCEYYINIMHVEGYFDVVLTNLTQQKGMNISDAWVLLKTGLITGAASAMQFIVRPIYYILCEAYFGKTIGMSMFSIIVIDEKTSDLIGLKKANKRYWYTALSHLSLMYGFLSMIHNKHSQTLHDRLCGTVVISR
jgi:uncharacterized RDD family membrane protein YckC